MATTSGFRLARRALLVEDVLRLLGAPITILYGILRFMRERWRRFQGRLRSGSCHVLGCLFRSFHHIITVVHSYGDACRLNYALFASSCQLLTVIIRNGLHLAKQFFH